MTFLHHIGEYLRNAMLQVPLWGVRALFLAIPILLLIWVWRLPPEVTSPPGGARRWDENLKLGATLALLTQIAVYALL